MKKIKELWIKYWNWGLNTDDVRESIIFAITLVIPVIIILFSTAEWLDYSNRKECLDSLFPRRYGRIVCEEYHNGEWIKVDSSKDKIYHYNEAASREER